MRGLWLLGVLAGLAPWGAASADAESDGILKAVYLRERGKDIVWDVSIDLIDRGGDVRERTGKIFRRALEGGRSEQVTAFLSPANIRHTALLKVEAEDGQDYMWLYVPALKITKQIPAAERGDKFVGTDFTMEDVNLGFEYQDYEGTILEKKTEDGHPVVVMKLEPKTAELKRELGFDHATTTIRTDQAIITDQRFFKGDREIRHNESLDIQTIDGIITPMELRAADLVNDHRTVMKVRSAKYNSDVPASYFGKEALAREMYR
jgi:hypothetical protein